MASSAEPGMEAGSERKGDNRRAVRATWRYREPPQADGPAAADSQSKRRTEEPGRELAGESHPRTHRSRGSLQINSRILSGSAHRVGFARPMRFTPCECATRRVRSIGIAVSDRRG